ncbi:hypothetical protein DPMN_029746 [Dreissena polymorpha]|uniref:Uncharacterized protein n=1 Tax=Dreissena polymorpha TaxID=45954 RepID=A0A9D4LXT4_DREPO|nr:hypothetical protein DPMN_029746 [Dreissena polymorpha]
MAPNVGSLGTLVGYTRWLVGNTRRLHASARRLRLVHVTEWHFTCGNGLPGKYV